ncbi:hypothetical protein MPSEU_000318500 [Mayamaea pseudoterrestris]|nr:hypothetical protein MPSEU_000318500 [Mayamaea pseudoterrestris]
MSPLSKHGFELFISNQLIDPNRHTVLQVGMDYVLRIKVTEDRFRGAFLRLEPLSEVSDTSGALQPRDATTQVSKYCDEPVVGIGTIDLESKPGVTGILRMDETANAMLDVTIVKTFTDNHITYAYSQYKIRFVNDMPLPAIPTSSPTMLPDMEQPASSSFCSFHRVQQCQSDYLSTQQTDDCNSCISTAHSQQVSSCDQMENTLCAALKNCSCGACSTHLEAYLSCAYNKLLGCDIDCSISSHTASILDEFAFTA